MTGTAPHMTLAWPPGLLRLGQLGLAAARLLVVVNLVTGAPLLALWIGARTQAGGLPSMESIAAVVITLAAVSYTLVALLRALVQVEERLGGGMPADFGQLAWLYGQPMDRRQHARDTCQVPAEPLREPLVLIDGDCGATRPWGSVTPHLEFGFEVLAGVLPRDRSIDGTMRAMDRVGWQTAHVVARPRDADVAVDLARLGRARSLLILASDDVTADAATVATEIAEFVAFRPLRG